MFKLCKLNFQAYEKDCPISIHYPFVLRSAFALIETESITLNFKSDKFELGRNPRFTIE